jgi:hypothetical protein
VIPPHLLYCVDCFADVSRNLRSHEDAIQITTDYVIHREKVEVSGEGIIEHIEDSSDITDFCCVWDRWSWVYIADV